MKKEIYVPIEFEHLLSILFGKSSYHGFVGTHTFVRWKKELIKIVRSIKRAIKINVDTDDFHRKDLLDYCETTIEGLKSDRSLDEVNIRMIGFSIRTIFRLLGHIPDNWDRRSVANSKLWRLDQFRKVVYIRTPEQKVNLILSLTDKYGYSHRMPKWTDLISKRFDDFRGDPEKFIEWFKKTYKDVYDEIV
jgi:hypothetical protein